MPTKNGECMSLYCKNAVGVLPAPLGFGDSKMLGTDRVKREALLLDFSSKFASVVCRPDQTMLPNFLSNMPDIVPYSVDIEL